MNSSVCFIQSCWHKEIVEQLKVGFEKKYSQLGDNELQLTCLEVPGVLEIPLQAKLHARSGRFDAIVVAGLIANHGIYRHEFVASATQHALMKIQIETEVPIIYGILTPQDFLSEGREEFFKAHFVVKGAETAEACFKTIENMRSFAASS